jgi:hypothetical protein
MISVEQMLKIDPELSSLSESELEELRSSLYRFAQLAFEVYWTKKHGSKNPVRLFPSLEDKNIINRNG